MEAGAKKTPDDVVVDATSVVRIVLQYLRENGFRRAFLALQEESGVALNTLANVEEFRKDFEQGRWPSVLEALATLRLPRHLVRDVYIQLFNELVSVGDRSAAATLLRECEPLQSEAAVLKGRLVAVQAANQLAAASAAASRKSLASKVCAHTAERMPPGRLLNMMGQALAWQHTHQDRLPSEVARLRECGRDNLGNRITAITAVEAFARMAVACDDGTVDLYDLTADGLLLAAEEPANVLQTADGKPLAASALAASATLLAAAGGAEGVINVWRLDTGACVRRLSHGGAVQWLEFDKTEMHLLSAGVTGHIQIWGLRGGFVLRTIPPAAETDVFRSVCWSGSDVVVAEGECLRFVRASSGEEVAVVDLRTPAADNPGKNYSTTVQQVLRAAENLLVAVSDLRAKVVQERNVVRSISLGSEVVTAAATAKSLYVLDCAGALHRYSLDNGRLQVSQQAVVPRPKALAVLQLPEDESIAVGGGDTVVLLRASHQQK